MDSNKFDDFHKMLSSVPLLKNVFYFFPLRIGNIVLGLAGTIFYLVIWVCLIIKWSLDPFTVHDKIVYGVIIVLSLIHAFGCAAFVVGIIKNKYDLISPWLWSHTIMTAGIVFFYITEIPSPSVVSFLFNYFLFQAYIWLCGYSIHERIRKRELPYSALSPTLSDKYAEVFSIVQHSDSNTSWPRTKVKCNTVEIKIHERLK